jgi:hypothetical protein
VDLEKDGVAVNRVARVGETFPIMLMVEHGGPSQEPVVFDTIVLEVLFNDDENVLIRVDPNDRPAACAIASNSPTTVDFFSGQPVSAGRPTDNPPFSGGTRLSLSGSGNPERDSATWVPHSG